MTIQFGTEGWRAVIGEEFTVENVQRVTQAIARHLHAGGEVGLQWWSALTGAWHSVVLFGDRYQRGDLAFGSPEPLSTEHQAVVTATRMLGIDLL